MTDRKKLNEVGEENRREHEALELFASPRGNYLMSQALTIAISTMEAMERPETSNIDDMRYIRKHLFPVYHELMKYTRKESFDVGGKMPRITPLRSKGEMNGANPNDEVIEPHNFEAKMPKKEQKKRKYKPMGRAKSSGVFANRKELEQRVQLFYKDYDLSLTEIGKRCGISTGTVVNILKELSENGN